MTVKEQANSPIRKNHPGAKLLTRTRRLPDTQRTLHELRSRENGGTVKTLTQKALIRAMAAAGTISTLVAIGGAGRKW